MTGVSATIEIIYLGEKRKNNTSCDKLSFFLIFGDEMSGHYDKVSTRHCYIGN
jgi:hypothetical protein